MWLFRLLLRIPVQMPLLVFRRGLLVPSGDYLCQKPIGTYKILFLFMFISVIMISVLYCSLSCINLNSSPAPFFSLMYHVAMLLLPHPHPHPHLYGYFTLNRRVHVTQLISHVVVGTVWLFVHAIIEGLT